MPNFNNYQQKQRNESTQQSTFNIRDLNPDWIRKQADPAMVKFAEEAGKEMAVNHLTSSKIRGIYGEIKRIQMGTFEQNKTSFYLLKPKVAYAYGRDNKNIGLKIYKEIFDKCYEYIVDEKTFRNFCLLIEAILAYHRANVEKDY